MLELTRRHTALLELAIRERPESWFWLHKRWKTVPGPNGEHGVRSGGATRAREERTGEEVR